MDSKRLFAAGLLGLFIASATATFTSEKVYSQTLRQRLRDRLDGENPNNPNPQQNQSQQANPQQQQMSGQQSYPGQQMPNAGQPMPGQYPPQQQFAGQASTSANEVSEVTLQTQPGPGGSQMVVTPKGMVVPLPGQGVNGNVVQVYIGGQGGFWYIDKNGQQVDLTPAVHAFQQMGTAAQQSAVPQYAPQPQVVNNYNSPQQQGGSGGSTAAAAMGTAAVAGMGAMAGSAIANSMYNQVPYGTPIHYGAGAMPYYNQGGKPVYINNSTNAEFNQVNNQHVAAVAQQQNWYKEQQVAQSANWKNWQQTTAANPFVRSEYANGSQVSPYGAAAADQYHNNNVQQQHEEQAAAADHYHNNNMQQQKEQQAAAADHYHNNNMQQQKDQQAAAADHYHNNGAAASQHDGAGAAAAAGESKGRFGRGGAEGEGGRFGKAAEGGGERLGGAGGGRRGRLRGER